MKGPIKPGREVMLMSRVKNGLGWIQALVILLALLAAITLMSFPAAGSAPPPQWVWDDQGRVHDSTGQYRRLSDEEACEMYDLCRRPLTAKSEAASDPAGSDGGPSDGGGC